MLNKKLLLSVLLMFIVLFGVSTAAASDIETTDTTQSDADIEVYSTEYTIAAGSDSATIQDTINQMQNGDVLNFENGTYNDICIYVDKNITLNGNGAILNGYSNPTANVPDIITNTTANGGYAIGNAATLYIINTNDVTISGFTIVGLNDTTYSNTAVYAQNNRNLTIEGNEIVGSSWGIYLQYSQDTIVQNNIIRDQATTGILNFGSPRSVIRENTITNAVNHGIDVRHGTGPNVIVANNTVIGSKEGIYIMHSTNQTVYGNTLINNTISGVSFYGATYSSVYNNSFIGGRLAIYLGGTFQEITIGENTYDLANLPYPPTFVYYVGIADSPYQSSANIVGVYSDSSSYDVTYVDEIDIPETEDIIVDYTELTRPTGTVYTVPEGTPSENIQMMIDSMRDGDTLAFESGAVYENICIYVDKNIKIQGNGATLRGYSNISDTSVIPSKIRDTTANGGYAIGQYAVLYIVNNSNVVVSDLNIEGLYGGYDVNNAVTTTEEYKTVGIYAEESDNLTITDCTIDGNSWGIYLQYCNDALISNNEITNQYTTGILNFGSPRSVIANNTITDAVNHGIDVRHGTGPNVTVTGNTISGAKEGIYLMHSFGHMVYDNTILNSQISGITAYGSYEEYIFNNTIQGSRLGILLGGGYHDVTIGTNSFSLDSLPFPPTFVSYLVQADQQYQSATGVIGTYSDSSFAPSAVIIANNEELTAYNDATYSATLKNNNGVNIAGATLTFIIDGVEYNATTDADGVATVDLNSLAPGTYNVVVSYAGDDELAAITSEVTITIVNGNTSLTADDLEKYFGGSERFEVTLVDSEGNPIANQNVSIILNGVTYNRTTDDNGVASMAINLNSGRYTAEVIFNQTGYDVAKATAEINVLSTVEGSDIEKIFRNGTQYYATFVDSQGNLITNTNMTFNINGVFYNRVTNGSGVARLNINLNPGTYIVTATNTVTGERYSNTITVLPSIIENNDLVKYFRNDSQYRVKVLDGQGNIVVGQNVTFNINGVLYNRVTDSEGYAQLAINLNPGNYIITASYGEYRVSNDITVLPVITADDLVKTYGQPASYNVTVVDGQGNPVVGQNVTININGVFYNRVTDDNGIARLNINLWPGEYIATAYYGTAAISNRVTVIE